MTTLQLIVLAIVQGLTEFLPISSSGHLILVPQFADWPDQGLAFDVAVHVGTLVAVVAYFWRDIVPLKAAFFQSIVQRRTTPDARLAWAVLIATIPVGLAGLLFSDFIEVNLRSPAVIAGATAGFGLLLWLADAWGKRIRDEHTLSWGDVFVVGFAQALALIPGTSRSGITMTAALSVGLNRAAAARFSFLLSIPVIALAGAHQAMGLLDSGVDAPWSQLAVATLLAAVSAFACIRVFLGVIERIGMAPFAIYRFALAGIILYAFYT